MNQNFSQIPVKNAETNTARRVAIFAMAIVFALGSLREAQAVSTNRHETIVILLDASGSMKAHFKGSDGSRMDAAKVALKTVIRQLPPTTEVGLLVFSSANLTNDWAFPLGARNDAQLFKTLDSIEPRIDTPLGRYLKIAADRLLEERAKNFGYGSYRLIVVTDGEAQDANLVNRYTPEIIARGIIVDVIGVAMNRAHTLATKVHSYRSANDSAALSRALSEVFAEVRGADQDAAGAEVFATIAPLPDGVATAMIQAVAMVPNEPIGETVKTSAPAPEAKAAPPQAMAMPRPQPAAQVQPQPQPQPQPNYSRRGSRGVSWTTFIAIIVVLSLIRGSRRGGR